MKTEIRDGMTLEQWESVPAGTPAWGSWSHTDHLLALVADRLSVVQWTLVTVHSDKGKAPKAPEPIPRPGIGKGPLGAAAEIERRESLLAVAALKARERANGAEPTEEQVNSMLDELMGDAR